MVVMAIQLQLDFLLVALITMQLVKVARTEKTKVQLVILTIQYLWLSKKILELMLEKLLFILATQKYTLTLNKFHHLHQIFIGMLVTVILVLLQ